MPGRDIIAIGGSFGAVAAIKRLCSDLPAELAASLAIVVHVGAPGPDLLATIFNEVAAIRVQTAADGDVVERGHAYVAPADHHLLVLDGRIRLGKGPRENMARPSIDPLFRSIGISYGPRAIGVVLTGLLNDGAAGLADLKRCGGIAIVQNPADAAAADMPLGALKACDVDYRVPLAELGRLLVELTQQEPGPPVDIPADIALEVDIALGRTPGSATIERLGSPVALSCPACGGVLSQLRQRPPLRFRCQVGHAYTTDALASSSEGSVDEAVRVALRIIEERITLSQRMAEEARRNGRHAAAADCDARAAESRRHAETLRRAIG
jgi:two-component system, chemotaxis family, protein-glutamate methylesterase/glutaminase